MNGYASEDSRALYRGRQLVWYILWIIDGLLLLRFFLKLFGAYPYAGFTNFIYGVTQPLVAPFFNVFRITVVQGSVFEWTTLLAVIVYWLIAWAITRLFVISRPVSTAEAADRLREENRSG